MNNSPLSPTGPGKLPEAASPAAGRGKAIIPAVLALHLALIVFGARSGIVPLHEPLNLLLLAGNTLGAMFLWRRPRHLATGAGIMFLAAAHTLAGPMLAPDQLTSGAILLVNIMVVYVGAQVNRHLPAGFWYAFVVGYFVLFALFILILPNAQPLFLLFLLGLGACARSVRLTALFWALVASFTFFQPYAWETLFLLALGIIAIRGARGAARAPATLVMLGCGLALVCLVLLPVLILVIGEDPRNMLRVMGEARVRAAFGMTLITATTATALLVLFLTPFTWALSRLRFPGRALLLALMDLPVIIPQSAAGIALVRVFGYQQPLGEFFQRWLGLRFDGAVAGIVLAQVFVGLPFMARSALAAFEAVPEAMEGQARTLGASPAAVFRRVSLPLAGRGIFLGAVLAWARAAGEFGAVLFIAPSPETAPLAVYNRFYSVGVIEAAPLAATLLAFSVIMFLLLQLVSRLMSDAHGLREREDGG